MKKFKYLFIAIWVGVASFTAQAAPHDFAVLAGVTDRVLKSKLAQKNPVVVFDLDDTLINTRARSLRIILEFSTTTKITQIDSLQIQDIKYDIKDTLSSAGVSDLKLVTDAQTFWLSRFFSDYCEFDLPTPGAVEYVNQLYNSGATIVYLTGRDTPRMGIGTEENLKLLGFPLDSQRTRLVMKSDSKISDLDFKKVAFANVSALGEVVATFENEPANINAMQAIFPTAQAVFLDTIHSPKADAPNEGIAWVGDFRAE